MKKKVLISGGSGMIGSKITQLLLQNNYEVAILSRNPQTYRGNAKAYHWDIDAGIIDPEALKDTQYIIHLAGAGIADKAWTKRRKETLLNSRVLSIELLHQAITKYDHQVKGFISASAIGYYGADAGQHVLTEDSPSGNDFLAEVTKAWEDGAEKIHKTGIRTVKLRIGMVLSNEGGALPPLVIPIKLFIGSPLGSGKQILSWIHIEDLCRMVLFAVENEHIKGVYNVAAPSPVSNKIFIKEAAKALKRPIILPHVPAFALKTLLGQRADLLLGSAHASSEKIEAAGFKFEFPTLSAALQDLLG